MHLRELIREPVNFIVCVVFVALVGLVLTSIVLENSGLPNPVSYFGGVIVLALLERAL